MKIAKYFENKTNDEGESRIVLTHDVPTWLKSAVVSAHCGDLPTDWVYDHCYYAALEWDELEGDRDDALDDFADSNVDVYTRNLYQWAADFCLSTLYSDARDEAADIGNQDHDPEEVIKLIQYCALRRIASVIFEACEENEEIES